MRISDWSSDVCSSDLGIFGLSYDAEVTPFTEGDTLTGGTSGATGTIVRAIDNGATGVIWLRDVTGTFEDKDRKSVEKGMSVSVRVDLGGRSIIKKRTYRTKRCLAVQLNENKIK